LGLKEWLIPQDKVFFGMLQEMSANVLQGASVFLELFNDYTDIAEKRDSLKEIEHHGDQLAVKFWDKLNRSFITPIDREDLSKLASGYDQVLDLMYGLVNRFHLYEISEPTEAMREFAHMISEAVTEIDIAFSGLARMSAEEINRRWRRIEDLETTADELSNEAVAALLKEKDPVYIIKFKEMYDLLEHLMDTCMDVADVLRDISIKR